MTNSYEDFMKELNVEFEEVKKDIGKKFKGVALDFLEYEVSEPPRGTPVLSGFTRDSWNISINAVSGDVVGVSGTISGASTAKHKQIQSISELKSTDLESITSIYINNGNDWISDLNSGTSTQTPQGFVELGSQYAEEKLRLK